MELEVWWPDKGHIDTATAHLMGTEWDVFLQNGFMQSFINAVWSMPPDTVFRQKTENVTFLNTF